MPTRRRGRPPKDIAAPEQMPGTDAGPDDAAESIRLEFEELGLSPYEARGIVALLRAGTATAPEVAQATGIPRTSTYQVLNALEGRGLTHRVTAEGPARWTTAGREEVLNRLHALVVAAQEQRIREHAARTERLKSVLADFAPQDPLVARQYVHVIKDPSKLPSVHRDLLHEAATEVLIFNRPPFASLAGDVEAELGAAVSRGVAVRVLCQVDAAIADRLAAADELGMAQGAYERTGVEARQAPELLTNLVVRDREVALMDMDDPVRGYEGIPTILLVEHPGIAAMHAAGFDHLWAASAPLTGGHAAAYPPPPKGPSRVGEARGTAKRRPKQSG